LIKLHEEELKIEEYFEDKKVYELFKSLMKDLTIYQPENPIDFLMHKLEHPKQRRMFIIGPPGSNRKEVALSVADHFGAVCISTGDVIQKELNKKNEKAKIIQEAKKKYTYVRDDIVIELIKPYIQNCEKDGKDWILEGFPRTV